MTILRLTQSQHDALVADRPVWFELEKRNRIGRVGPGEPAVETIGGTATSEGTPTGYVLMAHHDIDLTDEWALEVHAAELAEKAAKPAPQRAAFVAERRTTETVEYDRLAELISTGDIAPRDASDLFAFTIAELADDIDIPEPIFDPETGARDKNAETAENARRKALTKKGRDDERDARRAQRVIDKAAHEAAKKADKAAKDAEKADKNK